MKKRLLYFIFISILSLQFININAQTHTFESVESVIKNICYSSIDIGDFDDNGFDDILISGAIDTDDDYNADESKIFIYKNDNGVFTEIDDPDIFGIHLGVVKFIDIDNDGDLDIIATGQNYEDITKHGLYIYENNDGKFTLKQQFQGYIYSSVDCGDFNNDGYIDFMVSGVAIVSMDSTSEEFTLYENQKDGTFKPIETDITPVVTGCVKFVDYNNDGMLDIVTMGYIDDFDSQSLKTYKNNNGIFELDQELPEISLNTCWFDFADLDNDNYVEMIAHGFNEEYENRIYIYNNTNGEFSLQTVIDGLDALSTEAANSIAIADYNNDGYMDFIVTGSDDDYNDKTSIFKNNNGTFELVDEGLKQVGGSSSVAWIDYNNDNNIDLISTGFMYIDEENYTTVTTLYKNNCPTINQKPEPPTELNLTKDGNNYTFSWNNGKDDHTNPSNLKYLLTVSSANSEGDIMKYIVKGNSWQLKNIEKEIDNWSIQTIDGANVKSDKNTSIVTNINNNKISSTKNNFNIYPNPATNFINIDNFNNLDINVIKLIESTGKTIKTININNNNSKIDIDIQNINNGLYILEINYQDSIENFKFIKH